MPDIVVIHEQKVIWRQEIGSGLGKTLDDAVKVSVPDVKFQNTGTQDIQVAERWGVDFGYFIATGRRLYAIKFYVGSLAHIYMVDGNPIEHLERILPDLKKLRHVKKVMEA